MEHSEKAAAWVTGPDLVRLIEESGRGSYIPETIYRWMRWEPPIPIAKRGGPGRPHQFDPEAVFVWLDANMMRIKVSDGINGEFGEDETHSDPRLEKARQQARLAKLQADQLSGELMKISEAKAILLSQVQNIRAALDPLGERLAGMIRSDMSVAEIKAIGDRERDRVYERMADAEFF